MVVKRALRNLKDPEKQKKLTAWALTVVFLGSCLFSALNPRKAEASAVSLVGLLPWGAAYIAGDYAMGKIYINQGEGTSYYNPHIFEFDPSTYSLRETGAYFTDDYPRRWGAMAGKIGESLYWLGGAVHSGADSSCDEIFRLTSPDSMELVGYLPEGRSAGAAASYNGKIYMVGGFAPGTWGDNMRRNDILSFDGQTVRAEGSLPINWSHGDAEWLDGKLLIFGGYGPDGSALNTILQWDPATGGCVQIGTLPRAFGTVRTARVGESIYVFLPSDSSSSPFTEVYEWRSGQLYKLSVTIPERLGATCPVVVESKIFLFGGRDPYTAEESYKIWLLDTAQIPPGKVTLTVSQEGNRVTLSWDSVPHGYLYHVEHSTDDQNWSEVAVTTGTEYSTTLPPGKHYFRVRGESEGGALGEYSDVVVVVIAPEAPVGLTASVDGKTVLLNWQPVSGAASYIVQRSTDGQTWTQIAETSQTSYMDNGTAWSTKYYYRVIAKTSDGVTSAPSNVVEVTTGNLPAPTGLTASVDGKKVNLNWQPVDGATAYIVERSPDGKTWSAIATVVSTSYIDQSTQANTVYYYRVRAKSGSNVSDPSEAVMVMTGEDPPQVVSGLTAVWDGDRIKVTWNRGQNQLPAGRIELWKQTTNGVWLPVKQVSGAETDSFVWYDTGVASGLNCRYELRYLGGLGAGYTWYKVAESGWATGERPLPAPGGLRVSVGQQSAVVTWEAVSGASSYTVQYSTDGGSTWQSFTVSGISATVPRGCIVRVRAGTHGRSQWSGSVVVP